MNPYTPGLSKIDRDPPAGSLLGRPMASLVGVFVGGVFAAALATVLSIIAIMPPMRQSSHLDSPFVGILLWIMPLMAGGCGLLAGLTLGLFYRHRNGRLIAGIVGSLPAFLFYSQTYDSYLTDGWEDSPIPAMVESLILLFSAVAAVFAVGRVFVMIARRRANEKVVDESSVHTEGGITTIVTMALTAIAAYCDVSLYRILDDESKPFPEMFSIFTLVLNLFAVTVAVYLMAAHRCRRMVALECIAVAIFGTAAALAACYSRIWL